MPPNLEALDLSYDQSPSLEILERLPRLRRLKLERCEIGKLDCGNQIESLHLSECKVLLSSNPSSCTGLGELTELELDLGFDTDTPANLSFLSLAPKLRVLELDLGFDKDAPGNLGFLSLVPKLRVLRISTFQTLAALDFLKEMKRLEVLSVTWSYDEYCPSEPPVPSDISAIENCQQLKELCLDYSGPYSSRKIPGIKAIAGLTRMRYLWLKVGGFRDPNLELMRKMDDLEVLMVEYDNNLTSIRGIENKAKLRSLRIDGIRNVEDYSSILKTLPAYDPNDESWRSLVP